MADLRPGLRDELLTAAARTALSSLEEELVASTELESAEAPDRLARHLADVALTVLREMASAESPAEDQARVVNAAIAHLAAGRTDGAEAVALPPALLTGIRTPAHGVGQAHLPPAPLIALSDNELLVNSHNEPALGQQLRAELPSARDVDLLVSFVMWSGVRTLLDELRQVAERDGRMRVITTTYMGATQPKALDALADLGAEVRVDYDPDRTRLHAKAWMLQRPGGLTTAFLGSSNISHAALHQGLEWNVRLSEVSASHLIGRMGAMFESYWDHPRFERYDPAQDADRLRDALFDQRRTRRRNLGGGFVAFDVVPKPHQARMLEHLQAQRARHDRHRNLLVAATGTGKTIMAALDYRRLCEAHGRRLSLLFVAHRRRILDQSRAIFATVMRDADFGEMLGDGEQPLLGRQVFAMVQSVRNEAVERLAPDTYDVVVIDEVHHAAAPSYRALLERLQPVELLGLTATPERMDGQDITRWFGNRTAVELRLWEAIDDGYLAPFQYFGVHDDVDLSALAWRRGGYRTEDLERVYTGDDARVRRLLQALDRIVLDVHDMKALGFCVSVAHAEFMARAFTERGLPSAALSGDTETPARDEALARLQRGDLRCVFSVDVLGEGVDVPAVDTVLLLRPTQSATVLTQQIGRGLRQDAGKTTLTVVDLIGQQHRRFRFDTKLRSLIDPRNGRLVDQAEQGFPFLPGGCEIKLDRMSRDVVLRSLRAAAGSGMWSVLVDDLRQLGDVPLQQFLAETDRSPADLYRAPDRTWTRLRRDAGLPTARSGELEPALLRAMHRLLHLDDQERTARYRDLLTETRPPRRGLPDRDARLMTMLCIGLFGKRHRFAGLDDALRVLWANRAVRDELVQLLDVLDDRSEASTSPLWGLADAPLHVHARYTRDEALLALGDGTFAKPPTSREGVRWLPAINTDALFVTLRKSERRFSPSTRYRDYALGPRLFHWESQSTTSADSPTGRRYRGQGASTTTVLLFVRENPTGPNGAGSPFTLLGPASFVESRGERPMQIKWRLEHAIPESLLEVARLVAA